MSIGGISSAGANALTSAQLQSQVGVSVARKALDQAKAQGEAAVSLLDSAAQTQKAMVERVSIEPFKGTMIDVVA
ncbi:MAG: putative motility protein [Planctomycetota bacterium]